jgi:hypothetical protein
MPYVGTTYRHQETQRHFIPTNMAPITIHGSTIDPEHPPEGSHLQDASDTNYVLVQTTHPLDQKEFTELSSWGAHVLEVIDGNNTYRCRYEPHDLSTLEQLDFVKHALVYHQSFVLHDRLKSVDESNPHSLLRTVRPQDSSGMLIPSQP